MPPSSIYRPEVSMPRHMVDPPGGWRYGFPKAYDRATDGDDFMAWLVAQGYPQAEIDRMGDHFYVRQWYDADSDSAEPGFSKGTLLNPR
jgi:hypothetical protein